MALDLPFAPRARAWPRTQLVAVDDATSAPATRPATTPRLVVCELVGNAVRHARPLADGTMQRRLDLGATAGLDIAVTDGGALTTPERVDGRRLRPRRPRPDDRARRCAARWWVREPPAPAPPCTPCSRLA